MKESDSDQVLLIGGGVTLYEALDAADQLAAEGIKCRVLDPFTIKPIDGPTIIANAKKCGGRIITVEDHYPEGTLWISLQIAKYTYQNIFLFRNLRGRCFCKLLHVPYQL